MAQPSRVALLYQPKFFRDGEPEFLIPLQPPIVSRILDTVECRDKIRGVLTHIGKVARLPSALEV